MPGTQNSSGAKQRKQPPRWMVHRVDSGRRGTLGAAVVLVVKPRLSGPSTPPSTEASAPSSTAPERARAAACSEAEALVNTLSTRDKLAQLLMVGVTGAEDARAVAANHHVGGIMIGSWTDFSMLQDGSLPGIAASTGPLPLAVSVDEEGGRVQRLAPIIGSQPSPRILAATSSPDEVYGIALERGRAMKQLGITVDFAPVVDVTDAPDDTVIGDRSFGSDAETVTTYAGAYARGLRDAGLLPVLKHFPGHGRGSGDSHSGGVSTPPIEQLQADDLIPYRTLTTEHPVAVMLGHMQVPGLTGTDQASLSKPAYDLLRSGGSAARPSPASCTPTTCPAWPRSTSGTACPRRSCARCRPAPTSLCGSPPTRCLPSWIRLSRRSIRVS